MNSFQAIRESELHTGEWEVTEDGELYWSATRTLKMRGQAVKIEVERIEQLFTNGWLTAINSYYVMYALDNEGNKLDPTGTNPQLCKRMNMTANTRDRKDFVKQYWSIVFSMWNGYFRSALGFNDLPPFNSRGELIEYAEEQLTKGPVNNYWTHHSDGTPIADQTDESQAQ